MKTILKVLVATAALAGGAGCAGEEGGSGGGTHSTYTGTGTGGADGGVIQLGNNDDKIERFEFDIPAALGKKAAYLVARDVSVDLVGKLDGQGKPSWDFSQPYPNELPVVMTAMPLKDQWYASSFPGAMWAAPADSELTTDGIYSEDDQGIYLHGLATLEENPPIGQTRFVYDTKVSVYELPLTPGLKWTSVGNVSKPTSGDQMFKGLPYIGTQTYEVRDEIIGELKTPFWTFEKAHRVCTVLTFTGGNGPQKAPVQVVVGFVVEGMGEILHVTAPSDGSVTTCNFTKAAEVRRFDLQGTLDAGG